MRYYTFLKSPLKKLLLVSDGQALTGLYFEPHRYGEEIQPTWRTDSSATPLPEASEQLAAYFSGELREFNLPLALHGSEFQKLVWEALRGIPYGETISYRELAQRIGRPASIRAVGQANAHNPISIIVPCHRVIGANGSLVGYGGGLEVKAALLGFERSGNKSHIDCLGEKPLCLDAQPLQRYTPNQKP